MGSGGSDVYGGTLVSFII